LLNADTEWFSFPAISLGVNSGQEKQLVNDLGV
jgi:hypothetical protein